MKETILGAVIKKSVLSLCSIFCIITATFFLLHTIPGDPFSREMTLPKQSLDLLHKHYGLDLPIGQKYLRYLTHMASFDLGPSFVYEGRSAGALIQEALPVSFILGLQAAVFSLVAGCSLGIFLAKKQLETVGNRSAKYLTALGLSIPNFVLASLLQYLFALVFPIFPIGQWQGIESQILPVVALSFAPTLQIAEIFSASLMDIRKKPYITTAFAKGLSEKEVWRSHMLKNAFAPVLSFLVPLSSYLLTGSFIIEQIFSLPGLGQLMIHSVEMRDYGVIMGIVLIYAFLIFAIEWVIDVTHKILYKGFSS